MLSKFTKSTILTIAFILILLFAAGKSMAMRRESDIQPAPVVAVAQAEVRVILIGRGW